MKIQTMEDLFLDQIQDLYDAEKRLTKALPKMSKAATSRELKQAIDNHLEETKQQVERLEQAFEHLGKPAKGHTCQAMKGLIEEGEELLSELDQSPLLDAAIIAAGNRIEHYEIAGYGTARTYAQTIGRDDIASLLEKTLNEEKKADQKLTALAEQMINDEALRSEPVER